MRGTIFDIQKFALHDGPGIRTTVFLKGCPFKCVWCCNPESIKPEPQLAYDDSKCNQCLKCVNVCPTDALKENAGKLEIRFDKCNACGKCIEECPKSAFKIYGYTAESIDIIEDVAKDTAYFNNSGGGLTLSGGDPLLQFDFALDLLQKAKAIGINTCLETEGFTTTEKFKKLLPLVDFFYYDYKITDDFYHTRFTGVTNKVVIENLEYLCKHHAHVVLRCVIVPDINDNDEHFKAIAKLSVKYPSIHGVQIMPYHNYGAAKYKQIGKDMYPIDSGSVSLELCSEWIRRITELGGINISKG